MQKKRNACKKTMNGIKISDMVIYTNKYIDQIAVSKLLLKKINHIIIYPRVLFLSINSTTENISGRTNSAECPAVSRLCVCEQVGGHTCTLSKLVDKNLQCTLQYLHDSLLWRGRGLRCSLLYMYPASPHFSTATATTAATALLLLFPP